MLLVAVEDLIAGLTPLEKHSRQILAVIIKKKSRAAERKRADVARARRRNNLIQREVRLRAG
jgi:hypothetical protein